MGSQTPLSLCWITFLLKGKLKSFPFSWVKQTRRSVASLPQFLSPFLHVYTEPSFFLYVIYLDLFMEVQFSLTSSTFRFLLHCFKWSMQSECTTVPLHCHSCWQRLYWHIKSTLQPFQILIPLITHASCTKDVNRTKLMSLPVTHSRLHYSKLLFPFPTRLWVHCVTPPDRCCFIYTFWLN